LSDDEACNHELNRDMMSAEKNIERKPIPKETTVVRLPGEECQVIKAKDGQTMVYKQIKGKLASLKITSTEGWTIDQWYTYIMSDQNYHIQMPIQYFNDALSTLVKAPIITSIVVKDAFTRLCGAGRMNMDATEDIMPILLESLKGVLKSEARIKNLTDTKLVSVINDIKTGKIHETGIGSLTSQFFDSMVPMIDTNDLGQQQTVQAINHDGMQVMRSVQTKTVSEGCITAQTLDEPGTCHYKETLEHIPDVSTSIFSDSFISTFTDYVNAARWANVD